MTLKWASIIMIPRSHKYPRYNAKWKNFFDFPQDFLDLRTQLHLVSKQIYTQLYATSTHNIHIQIHPALTHKIHIQIHPALTHKIHIQIHPALTHKIHIQIHPVLTHTFVFKFTQY
nr:unnamed protein product [Callosobruchus chinensis]